MWSAPAYGQALWARYLDVFSSVVVAGRVSNVPQPSSGSVPASSTQVAFCDLPVYSGLAGFVRHSAELRRRIASAVQACQAVIVRSPSPVAYMASRAASVRGGTYGAEIVGDPSGVFSPGAYEHPLRLPIRFVATAAQREVTRRRRPPST